jgi:hypothetical protein
MLTLSCCACTSARCILCAFAYITSNSILCVCIQGAHKTLYTSRISISPQTDRQQQPFAGYSVCVYTFKLKKKARRFAVCCATDSTSGGGEKLVNSPMAGILYKKKKRIASILGLLLFGWGGRQFHEHNLLS